MSNRILYAGDTDMATAAAYLAGVLTHAGLPFDYVPSDAPLSRSAAPGVPRSYVLSDYPVKNLSDDDFRRIVGAVEGGSGLLMVGGWESFHGADGEYHRSPLAPVLPVLMQDSDDRVGAAQPCLVEKRADHPVLDGLPWDHPPGIGGYNRVRPRAGAEVLLSARHVTVELRPAEAGAGADEGAATDGGSDHRYVFTPGERAPLLVVGRYGRGRVAALTTDVAPHWVGGLVDWGPERVVARAPGAPEIDVGSWYAEFLTRLVRWTMGDDPSGP